MLDVDVFMELAGIAGVFVGFGALIAVRGGGASGALEVGYTRGMVSSALLAVVVALAPATLGRYPLTEHEVWALSSIAVLVGWFTFGVLNFRTPEYRANIAADVEAARSRPLVGIVDWASMVLVLLAGLLPPIVILLGVAPDLEPALYFTAVVVALLMAASLLLGLVFQERSPASA